MSQTSKDAARALLAGDHWQNDNTIVENMPVDALSRHIGYVMRLHGTPIARTRFHGDMTTRVEICFKKSWPGSGKTTKDRLNAILAAVNCEHRIVTKNGNTTFNGKVIDGWVEVPLS